MAAKFASTDREAFRRVNDAAHDARRITGRDHPEAELIHQINPIYVPLPEKAELDELETLLDSPA